MGIDYKIGFWSMVFLNLMMLTISLAFYNSYDNLTVEINERLAPYEGDHSKLMERHLYTINHSLKVIDNQEGKYRILLDRFIDCEVGCNVK